MIFDLIKCRITHFQQHHIMWEKVQQELFLSLGICDNHSSLLSQHLIDIIEKPFIYNNLIPRLNDYLRVVFPYALPVSPKH